MKTSDVLCRSAASAGNLGQLFRWAAGSPNVTWFPEPTDLEPNDNEYEPPELADSDDAAEFYLL